MCTWKANTEAAPAVAPAKADFAVESSPYHDDDLSTWNTPNRVACAVDTFSTVGNHPL